MAYLTNEKYCSYFYFLTKRNRKIFQNTCQSYKKTSTYIFMHLKKTKRISVRNLIHTEYRKPASTVTEMACRKFGTILSLKYCFFFSLFTAPVEAA